MTIDLISALKLIRHFGDSPEVVGIIDKTLEELERLYRIEAQFNEMATGEPPAANDQWAGQMLDRHGVKQ